LLKYTDFRSLSIGQEKGIKLWIKEKKILKYLSSTKSIQDFAIINALSKNNLQFNIVLGNEIGKFKNKIILFNLSRDYDTFKFTNYVSIIKHICCQLERQGNKVFPGQRDALFWENKSFMHKEFKDLNISHPETYLYKSKQEVIDCPLPYPFLIKEESSASAVGVHKVSNRKELDRLLDSDYFIRNEYIIVQKLINMKKDLRVTLVGEKIVHHYWRINLDDEWKPTSTGFGSEVNFGNFPQKWYEYIVQSFKKLNILTGALDITWENDNINSFPLILEVSSSYYPNPVVDIKNLNTTYGEYKKGFLFKDSYDKKLIHTVFDLKSKVINELKMNKFFHMVT
jgi:glutathione synthase/RimK-type ligase-like ATP-grasp enzyme